MDDLIFVLIHGALIGIGCGVLADDVKKAVAAAICFASAAHFFRMMS